MEFREIQIDNENDLFIENELLNMLKLNSNIIIFVKSSKNKTPLLILTQHDFEEMGYESNYRISYFKRDNYRGCYILSSNLKQIIKQSYGNNIQDYENYFNSNNIEIHPSEVINRGWNIISDDYLSFDKLIVGTFPPTSVANNIDPTIDFYYGSGINTFWKLFKECNNSISINNKNAIINSLKNNNYGIVDVYRRIIRKKKSSFDPDIISLAYYNINKLLNNKIKTIFCTSKEVKNQIFSILDKKYKVSEDNDENIHWINSTIKVISLITPGASKRFKKISNEELIQEYKKYLT